MAGETTTTAPPASGFVAQMKSWQNGEPAPTAGVPAADSPAPGSATPSAPAEVPAPAPPGSPAPGSESPAPPAGDQPPAAPADSGPPPQETPPQDPNVDQRVSDAQRKMHEATARAKASEAKVAAALAENTTLRTQIGALLSRAELQPVTAEAVDLQAAVNGIVSDYKKPAAEGGPATDDDAMALLIQKTLELGTKRATAESLARENQARQAARQALVRQTVNEFVSTFDPTLPLPLFWAVLPLAEAETPATLTTTQEVAEWQVKRAIAKATAILDGRTEQVRETTLHTERTQRAAGVVMPGGGSAAPVTPTPVPQRPRSMVDAVTDLQRRTMPAA